MEIFKRHSEKTEGMEGEKGIYTKEGYETIEEQVFMYDQIHGLLVSYTQDFLDKIRKSSRGEYGLDIQAQEIRDKVLKSMQDISRDCYNRYRQARDKMTQLLDQAHEQALITNEEYKKKKAELAEFETEKLGKSSEPEQLGQKDESQVV